MSETSINERIMTISGTRPCQCSCDKCKSLCRTPCIGTPDDINALLGAGYGDRLATTLWGVGMVLGLTSRPIRMIQPALAENGWCTFRRPDGLCELHEKGLKPLEGKLASCRPKPAGWNIEKDFSWLIAQTWIPYQDKFNNR